MGKVINHGWGTVVPAQTGRVGPIAHGEVVGAFRLPADPLFYADVTLTGLVVGSRYRLTRHDTGAELAQAVAAATTETVPAVAAYANPMQVDIDVRMASGAPYYKPFQTAVKLVKGGAVAFILQQLDQ